MLHTLEDLLDLAREAMLAGDLPALAALTPQIEGAVATDLDPPTARRVAQKADRNARLLQAAARGVRAAQARLRDITARPVLTTYDAQGRKDTIAAVSPLAPRRL